MDLTNVSVIRSHLFGLSAGGGEVFNLEARLTSEDYTGLPHRSLTDGSEAVKAIDNTVPTMEMVTVYDAPVGLAQGRPVPGTVVCASDSSLAAVFQENVDYWVDYRTGTIARADDGDIVSGSEIVVWYLYYHLYQRNVDYAIDYSRGRLRRLSGGSIEEGQTVWLDYLTGSFEFSDDEIGQCITEAETEIRQNIDLSHGESVDPALQTAATYLSLSLLCRNSAGALNNTAAGTTKYPDWMALAASYRETAMNLMKRFRPEAPRLKSPRRT